MKYRRSAAIVALMLSVAACDDPTSIIEEDLVVVSVTPTSPSVNIGAQITLTATVSNDTTGALSGVTWSSNNTSIATVNAQTGVVTGVAAGQALITATSKFDPTKSFSVSLTVNPNNVAAITVLGTGSVTERYTAEIAAGRGYAYTTTWGFRAAVGNTVKIWNTAGATPVLVDSLRITQASTTSDVQISPDSTLLVVSTEGSGGGSIVIYSLANPAKPTQISRFQNLNTSRGVHTVKLSTISGRLYAFLQLDPGAGNPAALMIVDITNPQAPQEVYYQTMGSPYIHDVFVRDGILFTALWNDGLSIFDVGGGGRGGSPSSPVLMGNVKTPTGQIHNIWWVHDPETGSKKYALLGEEGPSGSFTNASGDIHVIDVSNMSAPVQVATYAVPGAGAHNFYADEESGILYAAYYNGGVRALDVRGDLGTCTAAERVTTGQYAGKCDLRKMGRELATALTNGTFYVWGVTMQGNRLYASDMGKGIIALDITSLKR